jgi:peptidoglycan/LPS O-acetylase OafA/YrhL
MIEHFKYRPEIDGLRALAVLAVLFFHAGLGFTGGYVGVDVFFVISGYLITSLVVKDLHRGTFSLADFWERRARRILPPLAAMVLVTLVAGYFLLLPSSFEELGNSAVYQALFAANFYFWKESGYFAGAAEEMPLLHTWSLAVEEQFYLVLPLLLLAIFKLPRFRRRGVVLAVFGFGWIASFVLSLWGVQNHPTATFFLLPTRAWELLTGSILALLPGSCIPQRRAWREVASAGGVLMIALPFFWFHAHTDFPGAAALPPCLGTALIIWANTRLPHGPGLTATGLALATRPVVFVGLISYSLYLWHWPVIAFSNYLTLEPLAAHERAALLLIGLLLALASWRFIETPFRCKSVCAGRKPIFAFGGATVAGAIALGLTVVLTGGLPHRLPEEVRLLKSAEFDRREGHRTTINDVVTDRLERFGAPDIAPSVLLWGDSHSWVIQAAFDRLGREQGFSGVIVSYPQTAPLVGNFSGFMGHREKSRAWADAVLAYVRQNNIRHTFLAARWEMYLSHDIERWSLDSAKDTGKLAEAFVRTSQKLNAAGSKVWMIHQVPSHRHSVPRALAFAHMRGYNPEIFQVPASEHDIRLADVRNLLTLASHLNVEELDPAPLFLDPASATYRIIWHGKPLYYDHNHLSQSAVNSVIYPWLKSRLSDDLKPLVRVSEGS